MSGAAAGIRLLRPPAVCLAGCCGEIRSPTYRKVGFGLIFHFQRLRLYPDLTMGAWCVAVEGARRAASSPYIGNPDFGLWIHSEATSLYSCLTIAVTVGSPRRCPPGPPTCPSRVRSGQRVVQVGRLPARTSDVVGAMIEEEDNYLAWPDLDAADGVAIAAGNDGQEGIPADKLTESLQSPPQSRSSAPAGLSPGCRAPVAVQVSALKPTVRSTPGPSQVHARSTKGPPEVHSSCAAGTRGSGRRPPRRSWVRLATRLQAVTCVYTPG